MEISGAPFNMAIDTLMRLGELLRDIKNISLDLNLSPELKLIRKTSAVKSFFINAVPLLPEEFVQEKKSILSLRTPEKKIRFRKNNSEGFIPYYDFEFDTNLDLILMELSLRLQKERYFMPPKSDPRHSWKQE